VIQGAVVVVDAMSPPSGLERRKLVNAVGGALRDGIAVTDSYDVSVECRHSPQ